MKRRDHTSDPEHAAGAASGEDEGWTDEGGATTTGPATHSAPAAGESPTD